ncbi:hypothetical protein Hanom_Chr11g01013581 [Helianthus anomalus]
MNDDFSKKNLEVEEALNIKLKSGADKLPDNFDVTFSESSDDGKVESEVVRNVINNVLKSDSDSTKATTECDEDNDCYLTNYIPKSKHNLKDEPTLVMY